MMKFTVIGNPIAHSLSPEIHTQFAAQFGLAIEYTKTLAPIHGFVETIEQFRKMDGLGANVTLPFKEHAFQYAHLHSASALIAKAVNTLYFQPDGNIFGDNTDGAGFIKDIEINYQYPLKNKKILILGAGGAVKGILHPILSASPLQVTLANRTLTKATTLIERFLPYGEIDVVSYEEIVDTYDLIIDGTSFDAWPLNLSDNILSRCEMIYDLKYGAGKTPILTNAKQLGIMQCVDGLGMLLEQAALSFTLWTGFVPQRNVIAQQW